jgi:hypothetical protein
MLNSGFSLNDAALGDGLTMGNDARPHWVHIAVFKILCFPILPKNLPI